MTARLLIPALLLVGLAAGCGDGSDEPAYRREGCMASGLLRAEIQPDDRELGFTATEAIAAFGPSTGQLGWHHGALTEIAVRFDRTGAVNIDRYPPHEGWCYPTMQVAGELHLATSDGRLQERLPATLLAVSGQGGSLEVVFPMFDGPIEPASAGLIPADWRTAGNKESLDIQINAPHNRHSAFCPPSQRPSSDPLEFCNSHAGVLRFISYPPDTYANHHNVDFSKIRKWMIATWRW